jgi:hypothetical protein
MYTNNLEDYINLMIPLTPTTEDKEIESLVTKEFFDND